MYIYNTNEWLLDQVREQQLYTSHLSEAQSPWSNLRSVCVGMSSKAQDILGEHRYCPMLRSKHVPTLGGP